MKKFEVMYRNSENSVGLETVEAERWETTTEGRLLFRTKGETVAEYNVKEWVRVRVEK